MATAQLKRERLFEITGGVTFANLLSEHRKFSSLPFSGDGWGAVIGLSSQKGAITNELSFRYLSGRLTHALVRGIAIQERYFTADYSFLYRTGSATGKDLQIEAGGAVNMLYLKSKFPDQLNNRLITDAAGSISGAARIRYSFNNLLPGLYISDLLCVPVVSALQEQKYSAEDDAKDRIRIAYPDSFIRFINVFKVGAMACPSGNFSISYRFDYYNYSKNAAYRQALHGLEAAYTLIL